MTGHLFTLTLSQQKIWSFEQKNLSEHSVAVSNSTPFIVSLNYLHWGTSFHKFSWFNLVTRLAFVYKNVSQDFLMIHQKCETGKAILAPTFMDKRRSHCWNPSHTGRNGVNVRWVWSRRGLRWTNKVRSRICNRRMYCSWPWSWVTYIILKPV